MQLQKIAQQRNRTKDSKDDERADGHGVFLKGVTMFIISDDLHVIPSSAGTMVKLLRDLGAGDVKDLEERVVNIELKKIADLLKDSLTSKSPLTEMFLHNQKLTSTSTMHESYMAFLSRYTNLRITDDSEISKDASSSKMTLRLELCKPDNKIMFADAEEDFVDLLFSFLTIPLGSMVKILGGKSTLGCIDNLYKSVESLNIELFLPLKRNELDLDLDMIRTNDLLLDSGFAPQYGCKNQLLDIREQRYFLYYCYSRSSLHSSKWCPTVEYNYYLTTKLCNVSGLDGVVLQPLTFKDPNAPCGGILSNGGFLQSPAKFIVLDNLEFVPPSVSYISFLKMVETPLEDIEEHEIRIGKEEALDLLRASLNSTSALTNVLSLLLKKPKQEE